MFHSKQRLSAAPRRIALACALAAAGGAHAQTATDPAPADGAVTVAQLAAPSLPDTIVTANRVAQPLTDVLADVTLLDEQQIRESGAVTIADLLQRQPGLELSRNGGPGTTKIGREHV